MYSLLQSGGGVELQSRWREQQYVLRNKNPYDVYAHSRSEQYGLPLPPGCRPTPGDADLGLPNPSYPPWTYFTGIAFMWSSDWSRVRVCFAALQLMCLLCVAWWSFRQVAPRPEFALMFAAAPFALNSVCATLALAQLGMVVVGLLAAAHWCDQRDRPVWAGLFLGAALLKPTLSLPFLLPFLIKRRWQTLAVAAAYTAFASAIVWGLVGTDPLTMVQQMQASGVEWGITDYTGTVDPIAVLTRLGAPPRVALQIAPPLCLAIGAGLMWPWRHSSLLTLFAIAALVGRLWVFHHHYDDVILLFVLFGLAEVLATRFSFGAAIGYAVLWLSLWLPQYSYTGMLTGPPREMRFAFDCLLLLVQTSCLAVLLVYAPRNGQTWESDAPNAGLNAPARA